MFHPTTHRFTRILFSPIILMANWVGIINPTFLVKVRYFFRFHKRLNRSNPSDLNEKILYAKLKTDTTKWAELFDKYQVRNYVRESGCSDTLTELYGYWDDVNKIDFSLLPNSFIFKANNGDGKGQYIIVRDKNEILKNQKKIKKTLNYWLSRKYVGALAGEPYLRFVKPLILAEQVLPFEQGMTSLIDYKIWCINGKAEYFFVCSDRDLDSLNIMVYDREWNAHPEFVIFDSRYRKGPLIEKPINLEGLIDVAEKLSKPFPVVRADLYHINGKIYFGEMTFTSLGGMMNYFTKDFLNLLGDKIDIKSFPPKKK